MFILQHMVTYWRCGWCDLAEHVWAAGRSLGVVIFGGATLLLHDETFIKWKPSALYGAFGLTLLFGKLVLKRDWIKVISSRRKFRRPTRCGASSRGRGSCSSPS